MNKGLYNKTNTKSGIFNDMICYSSFLYWLDSEETTNFLKFAVDGTVVQPVFNPFSRFVPKLDLHSQLQLSLWGDPITDSVPKST